MPAEHNPLASHPAGVFFSQARSYEQVYIITGPSGAGKTTWCQNAARQAQAAVLSVAGLVSPAVYDEHGRKVAIAVTDLRSGQSRILATQRQPEIEGGCEWQFDLQAIAWANQRLQAACARDILIIDELGPLELVHGAGFEQGVQLLNEGCFSQAYVVVRPSLLPIARARWTGAHILKLGDRLP